MTSCEKQAFCSLSKLQTKPQLCFTFICNRPNDGSIFIPNKAQSTFSVGANSTQGEYSTGHFLFHKSYQMNCTSLPSFFLSHSPIFSPRDAWADGSALFWMPIEVIC